MFQFKQFSIDDSSCAMKVGTDAVLLGCWADVHNAKCIVDVGCGSGVISLMMAQRSLEADIIAIDVDADACECCRLNVNASKWQNRVEVIHDDITGFFPQTAHPLLIVSNPPFFNESLKSPSALRALARHGENFDVSSLINIAGKFLTEPGDSLAFIAPASRAEEIDFLLSLACLTPMRTTTVYSRFGKDGFRTLWQVVPETHLSVPKTDTRLYIRDKDNNYTDEYQSLTSQFYLDK